MIPDPHVMGIPYYIVKVFILSKYGIKNMNGTITISLLLISAIFLSGCTFKMNKEITDDDRYLKALNDFSYENQWIWKSGTFQPYIANQTNNYAEYKALELTLSKAIELGINNYPVQVFMDSKLVVEQLNGRWKVKNENLIDTHLAIKKLLSSFKDIKINHILRNFNKEADKLANQAMDSAI